MASADVASSMLSRRPALRSESPPRSKASIKIGRMKRLVVEMSCAPIAGKRMTVSLFRILFCDIMRHRRG